MTREHGRARYEDEDENSDENDDDDEVDIQVVEFWKRMGFEDIAEVFQKKGKKYEKTSNIEENVFLPNLRHLKIHLGYVHVFLC